MADLGLAEGMGVFRGGFLASSFPTWIRACYKSLKCVKIRPKQWKAPLKYKWLF